MQWRTRGVKSAALTWVRRGEGARGAAPGERRAPPSSRPRERATAFRALRLRGHRLRDHGLPAGAGEQRLDGGGGVEGGGIGGAVELHLVEGHNLLLAEHLLAEAGGRLEAAEVLVVADERDH